MKITLDFQRDIYQMIHLLSNHSDFIEYNIANILGVKTYRHILENVKELAKEKEYKLQLEGYYNYKNKYELYSDNISISNNKSTWIGYLRVYISDNKASIYLRFPSKSEALRIEIRERLENRRIAKDIRVIEYAKDTAVGIETREVKTISSMNENYIYEVLQEIYKIIS